MVHNSSWTTPSGLADSQMVASCQLGLLHGVVNYFLMNSFSRYEPWVSPYNKYNCSILIKNRTFGLTTVWSVNTILHQLICLPDFVTHPNNWTTFGCESSFFMVFNSTRKSCLFSSVALSAMKQLYEANNWTKSLQNNRTTGSFPHWFTVYFTPMNTFIWCKSK